MVRRGSTVRVRQRALQKPRIRGFSFRYHLQNQQRAVGLEPFLEPSGRKRPWERDRFGQTLRQDAAGKRASTESVEACASGPAGLDDRIGGEDSVLVERAQVGVGASAIESGRLLELARLQLSTSIRLSDFPQTRSFYRAGRRSPHGKVENPSDTARRLGHALTVEGRNPLERRCEADGHACGAVTGSDRARGGPALDAMRTRNARLLPEMRIGKRRSIRSPNGTD
jgi:hypothetical protein